MISPTYKPVVATRPLYSLTGEVFKAGNDSWKTDEYYQNYDFVISDSEFYAEGNTISTEYGGTIVGNAISKTARLKLTESDDYTVDDFVGACILLSVAINPGRGLLRPVISQEFYFVTSAKKNGRAIEIEASDIMIKADVPYVSQLSGDNLYLLDFLRDAVSQAGMAVSPSLTSYFKNYDFAVSKIPVGYTCRQIIGYIAMLACGNAFTATGSVPKASIEISSLTTDAPYNELSQWISIDPTADVVQITGLKTNQYYDSSGVELETPIAHYSTPYDSGYVFEFDNPFAVGREDVAISAMSDIMNLRFLSFRGTHIGYPLAEFGDYAVITHTGGTFSTFLTSINWDVSGATEFACSVASRSDNASVYEGQASAIGGGTADHSQLRNRNLADQHTIGAIEGLQSELDSKLSHEDIASVALTGTWGVTFGGGSVELRYYPATHIVLFTVFATVASGNSITAGTLTPVYIVPDGYRPTHNVAIAALSRKSSSGDYVLSTGRIRYDTGTISILTADSISAGGEVEMSGFWFIG